MRNTITAAIVIVMLVFAFPAAAVGPSASWVPAVAEELEGMLETVWTAYRSDYPNLEGGLALKLLSPQGAFFTSFGFDTAVSSGHRFRAASITKTFTAAAIVLLQQDGRLQIDDPVTTAIPGRTDPYLPDSAEFAVPFKEEITIRQLLQHWAGVFDLTNSDVPADAAALYAGANYFDYVLAKDSRHTFSTAEIVAVAAAHGLAYAPPETAYLYSDTGYALLGEIIERVSGQSYAEFVTESFLLPNGLHDSSFPFLGSDQYLPEPAVIGFNHYQDKSWPVPADNMSFQVANGNLISTPADLVLWARNLYSGAAGLDRDSAAAMMAVRRLSESYGYGLGTEYISGLGWGHSGAMQGYLSLLVYDPENDLAALVYSNVLNWDNPSEQMLLLRDILFQAKEILGLTR